MTISKRSRLLTGLLAAASATTLAAMLTPAAAQTAETQQIELSARPLSEALVSIGRAFDVSVIAASELTQGKTAPPLSGELTADQAVGELLKGSGLIAAANESGDFIITRQIEELPSPRAASAAFVEDQVVVTGTRIARTAVNSPAPIDIVTADDIARLGLIDETEALRFTPALNQSVSLSSQNTFGFIGPTLFGLATLDLRGLGENRTLVLVNGRRHVGGVASEATVDVASIPSALIDRVEVLTGGGSSIYGADAVSGVVNYVLKDDFEGVDYRVNGSLPTRGEGEAYSGALTMGGNFAGGRGNAVFSVEYSRQGEVQAQDRPASQNTANIFPNTPAVVAALGTDPSFLNVRVDDTRNAIFSPGARITFNGSTNGNAFTAAGNSAQFGGFPLEQIVDPVTGEIRPRDFGLGVLSGISTIGGDGSPFPIASPASTLIPDVERYFINAFTDYDFTDSVTGFIEAKYSRNSATAAPTLGLVAVEVPILQDNPFIPDLIQSQFDSLNAQGLDPDLVVSREFFDDVVTSRPRNNIRETFRIAGGFEGTISKALNYEVSVNYGRTDTSIIDTAEALPDRVLAALDVVADPTTGEPVCRSDIDPTALPPEAFRPLTTGPGFKTFNPGDGRCAPLNIFAPLNGISSEAVDFIYQRTEIEFELEQFVVNGIITGNSEDILALPAGGIGYAAGFEYREESTERRPDPLALADVGFNSALVDERVTGGRFDVFEGFAEVNIPVLLDIPFAKQLSLDASIRFADYSTVGSTTSFAVGSVWQPTDDLRIRGSFNRAIRAPNIAELFDPQDVFSDQLDIGGDPCDPNSVSTGSSNRAANCAQLVPDLVTFDPTPSYQIGNITRTIGGNPNLSEEKADTFTIGFAYTPAVIPGLSVVADYYNIDIQDAIALNVNIIEVLNNCADAQTIDNPFCDAVTRDQATGVVQSVEGTALNVSAIRSSGIDYQIGYRFDLNEVFSQNIGDFRASVTGTYLIERENELFDGFPETNDRLDGEYGFPKHFLNVSLAWENGPWSADYGFNFQSNQVFSNGFSIGVEEIEENPLLVDRPGSGSAFVHFLGGGYRLNEALQFNVRVNNLFDRDPFALRPSSGAFRPVSSLGRTVQLGLQGNF